MKRVLQISLLFAVLISCAHVAKAQTQLQDECGHTTFTFNEAKYDIGKFYECMNGLRPCIAKDGFTYDDKLQVYQLMAMCYLAVDSVAEADKYIEKLMTLNGNFQPDGHTPQRFRLQVAYIRTQLRAQLTSSVSKKMENIDLAPATMQILTAKEIQDRGYMDIESVFADLPGFDITRTFGLSYSVFYQRGYRSPALTERTMVLVDGIEDNELWTNSALLSKQYPLSSVKRIEVIYGPASTIYGANAFTGVINIVTKDEEDVFQDNSNQGGSALYGKPKNVALNFQTGAGSYNTKYVDGTLAARSKNVCLTVTGRIYTSDGVDLSKSTASDGIPDYGNAAYASRLTMKYSKDSAARYVGPYYAVSSDSTKIVATAAGIKRADSLDKALYKNSKAYNAASTFKDPINDFYVAAKLAMYDFKFGFQYWNRSEGSAGDYVDNFAALNSAYTNWQVRGYNIYGRYDKNVTEKLSLTSLTYYRYYDFGDNARVGTFNSFGNGKLTNYNLISGNRLPYFSTTNYSEGSNQLSTELRGVYNISDKFSVVAGTQLRTGIYQANYITAPVSPAVIYGTVDTIGGGNNFTTYTISGYATGSYSNIERHITVDIGGRVDDNRFREQKGYGTVFNPRVAVVYYPGKFIFKAIYSEAFLDASNSNKFSTSASRKLANPGLPPERVKNFELNVRYKLSKNSYVEVAGYRSYYNHSLAIAQVTLPNGTVTAQYQDIGKSNVQGIQVASSIYATRNISFYANATANDPRSTYTSSKGADSVVRTGDIAYISANVGVNGSFIADKLNLNLRANIVGDKPTGKNTSVPSNPLHVIPAYEILNATVGYRVVKPLLIQVGCNNILNQEYYSPGVRAADGVQYASKVEQPLRNYYIKLIANLYK